MIMHDEVNEPLGFVLAPAPTAHPARQGRFAVFAMIPIVLAVAIGAFAFGRHGANMPGEPVVTATDPRPAPGRAEPAPSPSPTPGPKVQPLSASADQTEAASVVNLSRRGAADSPAPLIIDVQAALAARKATAPDGRR
jgi:hypothetical protein